MLVTWWSLNDFVKNNTDRMHEEWQAYVYEMMAKHVVFQNPGRNEEMTSIIVRYKCESIFESTFVISGSVASCSKPLDVDRPFAREAETSSYSRGLLCRLPIFKQEAVNSVTSTMM